MKSRAGGGTSIPEPRSWWWLLALLVVAPLGAFITHRLSSGTSCGWSYGSVGGACRAIILLSVLTGLVAGTLAAIGARGKVGEHKERAATFLLFAALVIAGGTLLAKQFQEYRNVSRGGTEMDEAMCEWVQEKLPACIEQEWGKQDADMVRRSQPDCLADAAAIATYSRCMSVTDCKQVIACVVGR